jgi:hypothetical protein
MPMRSRSNASPVRNSRRGLLGGAVLLAVLVAAPATAAAAKKVALDFEGPAAKSEKVVGQALGVENLDIVGTAAFKKAAKKGRGEKVIARAAERLGVAAVVVGKVQKKGKKQVLVCTVHNGKDGAVIDTVEIAMKGGKPDAEAVASDLIPVVKKGEAPAGAGGGEEPEEKPGPEASAPVVTPAPEEAAAKKPEAGEARRPAFDVNLGASFWARRMSVSPSQSADVYNGKPVPGLRFDGAVYPAAFFKNDSIAAEFGVGFLVDTVWLSSELQGGGPKLSSTQTHWGVDARWLHRFGESGTSPSLLVAFTVDNLRFSIDRANAPSDLNVPDVSYMGFGPKVGLVLPLGTPAFRIGTWFSYLITSPSESNAVAGRVVDGAWGIDWALHCDWLPYPWLLARAQFGLTRFATSYKPAAPQTITGMADMYIGGLVTVGYVY